MLGGPVQIAYAVADVEVAAQRWSTAGIGPFFVREHIELSAVRVGGRPGSFDHSSAFAQWGPVMVELIHQHDPGDRAIVATSGVHHVAHFVDSFSAAHAELVESGYSEVLYAETSTAMPFAFFDDPLGRGHLIEIYERTAGLGRFYDMVRDAAVGWNGADPLRRL